MQPAAPHRSPSARRRLEDQPLCGCLTANRWQGGSAAVAGTAHVSTTRTVVDYHG